jgi:nucleoside-diphosphate-sugar epimerase
MKVILTGATGMVGEGVLLTCLDNVAITEVLIVGRRHYDFSHPKLKELLVPDFLQIEKFYKDLNSYDACFYCAGISSIGMNEADYSEITYDTTLLFAKVVLQQNPNMVFNFVSGRSTDSSEQGKVMWARVKGRTENALMKLGFRHQFNFRPALMLPVKGQRSMKTSYKILAIILKYFMPKATLTLTQVGQAMINSVAKGYTKQILEIDDIRKLAA